MRYETGIRATRALADGPQAAWTALEASPDFEPHAFLTFAKQGNVLKGNGLPQRRALISS